MPAGLEHGAPLSFYTLPSERAALSRPLKGEMSECRVSGKEQHPQERICENCSRGGSMLGKFQERQREQCDPGNGSLAGNGRTQIAGDSRKPLERGEKRWTRRWGGGGAAGT